MTAYPKKRTLKDSGKKKPTKEAKKTRIRVRRVSRGALIKKAHALMREIVMLRDKGCVCPPPVKGHSSVRQAGHIIRSTKGGSRFSLWNVFEQCSSCNGRHVRDWQIYQGWFEDKFGSERWKAVQGESKDAGLKSYELEAIIYQLGDILIVQQADENFKPYYTQIEILSGAWRGE